MLSQMSLRTLMAIRRQMLVADLFRYVKEIREIEDGYAFKFRRSKHLIERLADYLLFEGRNSPQLTFVILAKPHSTALWLLMVTLDGEADNPQSLPIPPFRLGLRVPDIRYNDAVRIGRYT